MWVTLSSKVNRQGHMICFNIFDIHDSQNVRIYTKINFVLSRFCCSSCYVFLATWPATCFRRLSRDTIPRTTPSSTVLRVTCGAARPLSAHPPPPNRWRRHSRLCRSPTWMAVRGRRPGEARPGFRRTWVLDLPSPRLSLRVSVSCSRGGPSSIRVRFDEARPCTFWARRLLLPGPYTIWVARSSSPYPSPFWIHSGPPRHGLGIGLPYGLCSEEQVARISLPAGREGPSPRAFWATSASRAQHPCSFWMHHGSPRQDPGSGVPCGRCSEEQIARMSVRV